MDLSPINSSDAFYIASPEFSFTFQCFAVIFFEDEILLEFQVKKISLFIAALIFCSSSAFSQRTKNPEAEIFLKDAYGFSYEMNFEKSVEKVSEAIKVEPNNANLFIIRAGFLGKLKNKEAVWQDVQTAISLDSSDKIREDGAEKLSSAGLYEEAEKICDDLIEKNSLNYRAYRIRYINSFDRKKYTDAVKGIIEILELKPKEIDPELSKLPILLIFLKGDENIFNYSIPSPISNLA